MSSITITSLKDKHGQAIWFSDPLADRYQEAGSWLEYADRAGLRFIGPVVRYDETARVVWLKSIWGGREVGTFRAEECRTVPFNEEGVERVLPIPTTEQLKAFKGLPPTPWPPEVTPS